MIGFRDKPNRKPADVRPWVAEVLSNEQWYRDGEPTWGSAQTSEEANTQRLQRVRFLRKEAQTTPELVPIADRLDSCWDRLRCMSGACPECGRAIQRYFVAETANLLRAETNEFKVASLVLDPRPKGQLNASPLISTLQQRVKKVLKESGVDLTVGGVDLSFNEDREGRFEEHWSPQLWFILPAKNSTTWIAALRNAYPRTSTVSRPLKILNWDGDPAALAYALKTDFGRRVSYTQIKKREDTFRVVRNTSNQPLRVDERIEVYRFLNTIGLDPRIFMFGARVTRTANRISIVKIRKSQISEDAQKRQLEPQNPLQRAQK